MNVTQEIVDSVLNALGYSDGKVLPYPRHEVPTDVPFDTWVRDQMQYRDLGKCPIPWLSAGGRYIAAAMGVDPDEQHQLAVEYGKRCSEGWAKLFAATMTMTPIPEMEEALEELKGLNISKTYP